MPVRIANPASEKQLSVVVPCFNEEAGLAELVRRTIAACDATHQTCEILLVDDGSSDTTWSLIEQAAAEHPEIRGIRLSRNYGHQIALTAGLSAADGERVLMLDADLQDPPELLPEMLALMDQGYDVVYGKRTKRKGESVFKRASASLFYRLIQRLSDVEIPVDSGDFRLVSRRALDQFLSMPERSRYVRGMFAWIGFRQIGIEYEREERFAGETKYPFGAMLRFASDALTGFSTAPLRLATTLAYLSLAIAGIMGIYVVISLLVANTAPGWASLLLAVSFFSAMQLLTLGILGEYIGRLYTEAKQRPLFLIDRQVGGTEAPAAGAKTDGGAEEEVA